MTPGAVWSPALPPRAIRPGKGAEVLPSWTGVSGAQLLHLLLPPLRSVGGLFNGWTPASPSNHQVPAKQRPFGQQLWPHNSCVQQRQSTTGESSLTYRFSCSGLWFPVLLKFVGLLRSQCMCLLVYMQGITVENICFELRYLPDTRSLAKDHSLLLLCDLSHSNPDAVEVAIVSELLKQNKY